MPRPFEPDDEWLTRIHEAVAGLRYGTVQIVVHDGRVVQIERTERFRYDAAAKQRHQQAAPRQEDIPDTASDTGASAVRRRDGQSGLRP